MYLTRYYGYIYIMKAKSFLYKKKTTKNRDKYFFKLLPPLSVMGNQLVDTNDFAY